MENYEEYMTGFMEVRKLAAALGLARQRIVELEALLKETQLDLSRAKFTIEQRDLEIATIHAFYKAELEQLREQCKFQSAPHFCSEANMPTGRD